MFKTFKTIGLSKMVLKKSYSNQHQILEVLGAVRTPFHYTNNPSKAQLATQVIDELIKRASLSKEHIHEIQVVGLDHEDAKHIQNAAGQLSKTVQFRTSNTAIEAFGNINGRFQAAKNVEATIVCGVDFKDLAIPAYTNGNYEFGLEMMPIFNRERRSMLDKDDTSLGNKPTAVAAAVALTKSYCSNKLNVRALGSLSHTLHNGDEDVGKALLSSIKDQSYQIADIVDWELLFENDIVDRIKATLNLDPKHVNQCDMVDILQQLPTVGPIILLTYLIHKLKSEESACIAAKCMEQGLDTFILKKNSCNGTEMLPKLTLYTKNSCPLCDDLVEELEQNFKNQYRLEKIFIDRKENVKFLRLYRHDIPVLFLNGYFVCMHRLNMNALRQMLSNLNRKGNT